MTDFITAGHQYRGNDKGVVTNITTEARQAVETRDEVTRTLRGAGRTVINDNDTYNLRDTIKQINKTCTKDDIAIDIHYNASIRHDARGVEVFYYSTNLKMKLLAENLAERISAYTGFRNRGAKPHTAIPNRNGYLRETHCPALIVEGGFLDSKDAELILDSNRDDLISKAISDEVLYTYQKQTQQEAILGLTRGIEQHSNAILEITKQINDLL